MASMAQLGLTSPPPQKTDEISFNPTPRSPHPHPHNQPTSPSKDPTPARKVWMVSLDLRVSPPHFPKLPSRSLVLSHQQPTLIGHQDIKLRLSHWAPRRNRRHQIVFQLSLTHYQQAARHIRRVQRIIMDPSSIIRSRNLAVGLSSKPRERACFALENQKGLQENTSTAYAVGKKKGILGTNAVEWWSLFSFAFSLRGCNMQLPR